MMQQANGVDACRPNPGRSITRPAARTMGEPPVPSLANRREEACMSKLIRMDHTGHSTLAEWSAPGDAAHEAAVEAFRRELDAGYIGVVPGGPGHATQVTELPAEADLVVMRRPIAGG
jgi:hypothetical protein